MVIDEGLEAAEHDAGRDHAGQVVLRARDARAVDLDEVLRLKTDAKITSITIGKKKMKISACVSRKNCSSSIRVRENPMVATLLVRYVDRPVDGSWRDRLLGRPGAGRRTSASMAR